MYDILLNAIKQDQGLVNALYNQAKTNITYYLTHGQASNFDGHTQLWDAQKVFHVKRNQVLDFVNSVFTANYLDVDTNFYSELKKYQHIFTTDPYTKYPYKVESKYNFDEFLKGNKLIRTPVTYTIDIMEHDLPHDEYISRLYYRRRQGWGKSIIGVNYE